MQQSGFSIELRDHVLVVRFSPTQTITPELLRNAVGQWCEKNKADPRNNIWDLRGCQISDGVNHHFLEQLVDEIALRPMDRWHERTCLLVADPLQYGLGRMFQVLAEKLPYEVVLATEEQQAWAFVTH